MRIALACIPHTDTNLRLAAQMGATDVVARYPQHLGRTLDDTGKTDMAACIRAYREIGFTGPARPDHVPTLEGESNELAGYHMQGRLFAVGYMRGLLDATA